MAIKSTAFTTATATEKTTIATKTTAFTTSTATDDTTTATMIPAPQLQRQ